MKKITDFIINKRHFILFLFIVLTVISAIVSTKVKINHDMAEYLPDTSETRIGMDIMEDEFSGTETSTLNLMFENLKDDEKLEIKDDLENIDGVEDVDYDETDKYNKDKYTLYTITVKDKADSKKAISVYKEVNEKYEDYTLYESGDIYEDNKTVLPIWIIVLAVMSALVILLIMCESYVEPILFLTSILMAVILNKGTNIIFPNVSNITNSIAAILQMALSMDYSIMLMNRYDQEKKVAKDKIEAMKNALYKAFTAISSSSVTTIVGLLALIFMSFKIGKDLGFVLAKGVLFSLVCIFFVLPDLILIFDKWIVKSKKRSPKIKLNWLGKFSNKIRFVSTPIFVAIFVTSFILKGNLGIDYTDIQENKIDKVFKENNQMAIIYKNEDEDKIEACLKEIENKDKVDEVLAYGNTINEKLNYKDLKEKIKDLGSNVDVEDYLLKIVYYDYFNKENDEKMTFDEFINFIETEAYNNEKLDDKIDEDTKKDVTRLKNFVTVDLVNQKRTSAEISEILDIDEEKVKDIFIYYLSKNNDTKISLNEFVRFMNNDVLTNEKYANRVDNESRNKLNTLSKFLSAQKLNTKMTSSEIADLFGIENEKVNQILLLKNLDRENENKLSITEFINNVVLLKNNTNYLDGVDISKLESVAIFSKNENNFNTTKMNKMALAQVFNGLQEGLVDNIYLLLGLPPETEYTPQEFVNLVYNVVGGQDDALDIGVFSVDTETLNNLKFLKMVIDDSVNTEKIRYSTSELSYILNMDKAQINKIYNLIDGDNSSYKVTPYEFVKFILENQEIKSSLDENTFNDLNLAQNIMNGVLNGKKYSSYELSTLLNIDGENLSLLYGLYSSKYVNQNLSLSLKKFIDFLLNDVVNNNEYSKNFEGDQLSRLHTVNGIMKATENNTEYTSNEIFGILSSLSDNVEKNTIEVLYIYYGSYNKYDENWKMTVEEFVKFLNEDILKDERFTDFIDDEMKADILDSKKTIKDAKELLIGDKYSRIVLNTKYSGESKETFEFVQDLKDILKGKTKEFYVIGDSPMAYEISKTFNNELNLITVITMVAIFVVVAITFKSIIIPIILVLLIQTAVYLIMGILSIIGENVYFISILIVQSILMGATIDYAILYTSFYLEHRKDKNIKEAIIASYNSSIHTILTSSSILIIVTLIIANFTSAIASKICKIISQGTLCSTILILTLLPAVLACFDRFIVKKKKENK